MSTDDILARARTFLQSVKYHDDEAKRKFLAEKGLTQAEIDKLLAENPVIPPRTYPQPAPSALPNLLLGLLRVLSWISGGSAVLILIYQRFLLPRIIRTQRARQSLQNQQLVLIQKLSESLRQTKEFHSETLSIVPHESGDKEPELFAKCNSVDEVLKAAESQNAVITDISRVSLLRCAILDYSKSKENVLPNTDELFQLLEEKIPFLLSEQGVSLQHKLWETLSTSKLFSSKYGDEEADVSNSRNSRWAYVPPSPLPPSALSDSLTQLRSSLQAYTSSNRPNPYQHTLQTLSEFTGYISAQTYMPYHTHNFGQLNNSTTSPAEEDLKKEIRSLKGLVLNRRAFLPPSAYSPQPSGVS